MHIELVVMLIHQSEWWGDGCVCSINTSLTHSLTRPTHSTMLNIVLKKSFYYPGECIAGVVILCNKRLVLHGLVWSGMVWYGMVGMVWQWYDMMWYGMELCGMVWYRVLYVMVCCGIIWFGIVHTLIHSYTHTLAHSHTHIILLSPYLMYS